MTLHRPLRAALLLCAAAVMSMAHAQDQAAAPRIASVEVVGTAFRVALSDGRILQGTELTGAILSLVMPGDTAPRRVRLEAIVPDPMDATGEVLLHRVSLLDADGVGSELCEADPQGQRWMFPLRGQWDAEGHRMSEDGVALTCSAGAQGKCVRFGYHPWRTLADGPDLATYHRGCVHLVRVDYCGDHATTRNGMAIDIYDRLGIQRRSQAPDELSFEAAWGADGALCVAHTRVPANMTLDGLSRSCPALRGRLGPAACGEATAQAGPALLFNLSR